MAERPGDFDDIDLDEEEDEETTKPGGAGEEPVEPIDLDEDEEEEAQDLKDDREPEVGAPESRAPEDEGNVRDGIQRAAAVLKYIVENIVDDPDAISIGATTDDRGPVLLLRVAEDDRGKVIGRQGRIVQAIRTVVKAATVGTGERVSVEIID